MRDIEGLLIWKRYWPISSYFSSFIYLFEPFIYLKEREKWGEVGAEGEEENILSKLHTQG